jgi:hypothetical protein
MTDFRDPLLVLERFDACGSMGACPAFLPVAWHLHFVPIPARGNDGARLMESNRKHSS